MKEKQEKEINQARQEKQLVVTNVVQYIKSMSFESKISREELLKLGSKIEEQREFRLSPKVVSLLTTDNEYEAILGIQIASTVKDTKIELFQLTMEYSGIYKLEGDISKDDKEKFCFIHCLTLLFPFLRTEIANLMLKTGYQPVLIDPIDFGKMYEGYREQKEKEKGSDKADLDNKVVH